MKKRYAALFLSLVSLLFFWKVLFHRDFTLVSGSDTAVAYYPWFNVAAYWLKRGVFLLWDPYVYAGKLNMGEPQPGLYYPLNWVFMILPARGGGMSLGGMQGLLVLDYFLASFFFYLLARSFAISQVGAFVAGIAWAYGGYTIQIYGYANVLSGFVWLPLVVLSFRGAVTADTWRRAVPRAVAGGLCLGLSFLAGHHIPPIHIGLFLLFYAMFTAFQNRSVRGVAQRALALGAVAVVALLLTCVQWLPSAEWAKQVYRWVGEGPPLQWGQSVSYSVLQRASNLSPQDTASLVLPYVSTNANIYIGMPLLFLCLVGLLYGPKGESRFFAFAAFLYLFLSWGRFSAVHGWVNTFVPAIWFAREVFYYLIIFQACLALLAGWGLDRLVAAYSHSGDEALWKFVTRSGWALALLVTICGALLVVLHLGREMPIEHPYFKALGGLVVYSGALGCLMFFLHNRRITPRLFSLFLLALIVLDLASRLADQIRPKTGEGSEAETYPGVFWRKSAAAEFLTAKRKTEFFRVDDPSHLFPLNFGDTWRLESTMGHGATALVSYFRLRSVGWNPCSNASALLNVRYFLSRFPVPELRKAFESGIAVYENPRAVPRAFVASRYHVFSNDDEMLQWIRGPMMRLQDTVLLRKSDLAEVPAEFLQSAREEDDLGARIVAEKSPWQERLQKASDAEEREKLLVSQPPWGWTNGDELSLILHPKKQLVQAYLTVQFYPRQPQSSRLQVALGTPTGQATIPVELEGIQSGEASMPSRKCIPLGSLAAGPHRLTVSRKEECSAAIDNIGFSTSSEPDANPGDVIIKSYKPNRILLAADIRRPSFLVLSEVFYPGWEALVDGRPAPMLAGDYILRTIPISEGKHNVELRFRSRSFHWGLGVTLVSAVLAMAVLSWAKRP